MIMNSKAKALHDADLEVLAALGSGEENAKTRTELTSELGIGDRELRRSISNLRYNQHPIGLSKTNGYFIADKPDELNRIIAEYASRAKKINNIKNALLRAKEKMEYC